MSKAIAAWYVVRMDPDRRNISDVWKAGFVVSTFRESWCWKRSDGRFSRIRHHQEWHRNTYRGPARVEADLDSLSASMKCGYVWDCLFQEIDLETGAVLFEWRASDHFNLADSFNPLLDQGTCDHPYNWFHITSVDKNAAGNYLISARYTHSVTCIDSDTGVIL